MDVRPRFRPDLEPFEHDEGDGEPVVVLKDPVSDRYFRLSPHEYRFLKCHDGTRTLVEAREAFARAGHSITEHDANVVLSRADGMGLFLATASQRAKPLHDRQLLVADAKRKHMIGEFFFVFVPLWNPDAFLQRTLPLFRLFVNRWTKALMMLLAPGALYLLAAGWPRVQLQYQFFFSFEGVVTLTLSSIGVKIIHELSHGWVAKGLGLRVPRMGVAFLLWVPYLYCDTTDAWQLGSRRQRIAVSAAGIVAEIVMAILSVWVWYFTRPGLVNSACFHIMAVSLISTVLLNANPLMKRDGYYILSDLLRAPNLAHKSFAFLKFVFMNGVLGIRAVDTPADSPRDALVYAGYGVAAFAYKVVIYSGIVSAVYHKFDKTLGLALAAIALFLFVVAPIVSGLIGVSMRWREIRPRPAGVAAFAAALALGAFAVTHPLHTRSLYPCYAGARRTQQLAVPLQATVGEVAVRRGSVVKRGALLFGLRTEEAELALKKKELERDLAQKQYEQMLVDRDEHEHAKAGMKLVEVSKIEEECRHLAGKLEVARRGVVAPFDAVVTRFDGRMQPGYRPGEGVVVGELEEADDLVVQALVPDRDRHEIRVGQDVKVLLHGLGEEVLDGTIEEISSYNEKDLRESAFGSAVGGELATEVRDTEHREIPLEPQYRATVRLAARAPAPDAARLRSGMTGRLAVPHPPRSLLQIAVDSMYQTFNRESLI